MLRLGLLLKRRSLMMEREQSRRLWRYIKSQRKEWIRTHRNHLLWYHPYLPDGAASLINTWPDLRSQSAPNPLSDYYKCADALPTLKVPTLHVDDGASARDRVYVR